MKFGAFLFAVLMVGVVWATQPVTTRVDRGHEVWGTIMAPEEAAQWVAMAEQYSRYTAPPGATLRIDMVPADVFDIRYCGRPDTATKKCGVLGFYNEEWALDMVHVRVPAGGVMGAELKATLLHESVHWLQVVDGNHWPNWGEDCADLAAAEAEAYAADYAYQVEQLNVRGEGFKIPDTYGQCMIEMVFRAFPKG
jgi:hypothetical protein